MVWMLLACSAWANPSLVKTRVVFVISTPTTWACAPPAALHAASTARVAIATDCCRWQPPAAIGLAETVMLTLTPMQQPVPGLPVQEASSSALCNAAVALGRCQHMQGGPATDSIGLPRACELPN